MPMSSIWPLEQLRAFGHALVSALMLGCRSRVLELPQEAVAILVHETEDLLHASPWIASGGNTA